MALPKLDLDVLRENLDALCIACGELVAVDVTAFGRDEEPRRTAGDDARDDVYAGFA